MDNMSETLFLTIDLDIESEEDITLIVESFGDAVVLLRHEFLDGTYYGSFETGYSELSEIVSEYGRLVEKLSAEAQIIWTQCKKTFDIGYRSGAEPYAYHSVLSPEIITKIASLDVAVAITIYSGSSNIENR